MTGQVQTQNNRGEWVPAIPLPLYGAGYIMCGHLLVRLQCHAKWRYRTKKGRNRAQRRYREHYALVHILGLD